MTTTRRPVPAPTRPRLLLPPLVDGARAVAGPAEAPSHPTLRSVRASLTEELWPTATPPAPERPPLPDPLALCGPLVLTAVEAISGARPVAQLLRWVTPEVYEVVVDACAAARRASTPTRRRCRVVRARVCRVSDRVAEGTVVVHDGDRVRAAAVRLEEHRGRWRATALQIG